MKIVYLVRHAKSSWDDPDLDDFDRPLNGRGKKDVSLMGSILQQQNILPDLLLSSPAERAYKTAIKLAKAIGYPEKNVLTNHSIYHADPGNLLRILQEQEAGYSSLMLIGHNPGLTELAEILSRKAIDNIPTCGMVCIEFAVERWSQIMPENGMFRFFDYPKKHK